MTKAIIRQFALDSGLSVWDRPAMPCLASRIPYGTAVTVPLLRRIDRAESAVRGLGFRDVRVRDQPTGCFHTKTAANRLHRSECCQRGSHRRQYQHRSLDADRSHHR